MNISLTREGITMPLAIISVGIVVGAAGGFVPGDWLPRASDSVLGAIPHVNVMISLFAIATIGYGWNAIRHGDVLRHRRAMLLATGLFAAFLILYLYRLIVLGGPTGFDGHDVVYRFVYLPILALHIGLAIICIPLLYDAIGHGLTIPAAELPQTRHPRVGRIAATLWIISFTLGIAVYVLIYWI